MAQRTRTAAEPGGERSERDQIPDARDGLTREQRVILHALLEVQRERGGRNAPTAMLYGRVCEKISISPGRFQALLSNLVGRGW